MSIESPDDLHHLRIIGRIVAEIRDAMLAQVRPGVTTGELDALGARMLATAGAISAPLGVGFPEATCISVNEEVAHGIPGRRVIRAGDVVNIDVSASKNGYFADTGATMIVEPAPRRTARKLKRLLLTARRAQAAGMQAARPGATVGSVGRAMEQVARRAGFRVIRNLCSHGVGRAIHEAPEIPGYDAPHATHRLKAGDVITIEPFVTTAGQYADEAADGWTLINEVPRARCAQFEHTMVVTEDGPLVLTAA